MKNGAQSSSEHNGNVHANIYKCGNNVEKMYVIQKGRSVFSFLVRSLLTSGVHTRILILSSDLFTAISLVIVINLTFS